MNHNAEAMIRETLHLYREYILMFEEELQEWKQLRDKWSALVDEWAERGAHSKTAQQKYNKQFQRVFDIVSERTEFLKMVSEEKTSRLQVLTQAIESGTFSEDDYQVGVQAQIRNDIEFELMRRRMISDRMRKAVEDFSRLCSELP